MITLNSKGLKLVLENQALKGKIAQEMGVTTKTIERWVELNDVRLTTTSVLQIIYDETGIPAMDILIQSGTKTSPAIGWMGGDK